MESPKDDEGWVVQDNKRKKQKPKPAPHQPSQPSVDDQKGKSRNSVNNDVRKKSNPPPGRNAHDSNQKYRDVSASSSGSASAGRPRGGDAPGRSRGGPHGGGGGGGYRTGHAANINASAASGSNSSNSEAGRKSSNPAQQKTVWGKPLVGEATSDAAAKTTVTAPAIPAWGPAGKAVAPAESAPPKTAWNQPAPAAIVANDSKSSTSTPKSASVSPPPEKVDSESSKNLSAASKPEDSSVAEKPSPVMAPPAAASWATVTSAPANTDTAATPKTAGGLPAGAVWAKPGSQAQPDETQTASAAYVAPRAPWAKPEKTPEPSEPTSSSVSVASETPIAPAEVSTSETDKATNSPAVEASRTENSEIKSAEIVHVAAPDETDSAPALVPEASDKDESIVATVKHTTDLADAEAVPAAEKVHEHAPTDADAGPSTPTKFESEENSAEKKSPESPVQVSESEKEKVVVDEVTAVLTRLDLNSNKTDSVLSPGTASGGNSTTSSSKSGSMIKLKYDYKDDQWSPVNTDGKKQYDRDFLLQLQAVPLSLEKPLNLPMLDIIKDKQGKQVPATAPTNNWMPGFVKPTSSRSGPGKKASRDGSKRSQAGNPKVLDVKLEKVELHHAENAWKPNPLKEQITNGDTDSTEVLARKARGILNKLCPQKFDVLVEKFNDLEIDTEEKLSLCMELVFEKAVDEPGFSVAYARMCEVLQKKQVTKETMVTLPDGSTEKQLVPINFRKLLLSRCQKEFEKDYMEGFDRAKYEADLKAAANDENKKLELEADYEEKERRARRRSTGNVQFIGELYKRKMLSAKIMHECIRRLISLKNEESLESLCKLLHTIGKGLEQETVERFNANPEGGQKNLFEQYFDAIEKISDDKAFSSRVRFLLKDVVDLRRNYWKPRRDVAGPKTIDQIHEEHQQERLQQQLMNEQPAAPRHMRGGNDGRKKSSRSGLPPSGMNSSPEDGWKSVQKVSQRLEKIDASKIENLTRMSNRRDANNLQLGPGSRIGWSQGSGGQQRLSRKEETVTGGLRNKFSMLNDGGISDSSREHSEDRSSETRRDRVAGGPSRSMMVLPASRESSIDAERKRALEAVRQTFKASAAVAGGPSASVGHPNRSRPVPENLAEAREDIEQAKQLKGKKDLAEEKIKQYTRLLVDEYLHDGNEAVAVDTVCTHFSPSTMAALVESVTNYVLEKSGDCRKKIGVLLILLVNKNLLLKTQFVKGIQNVLEFVADLVVDVPKAWDYFGELFAPLLSGGKSLPLNFLRELKLEDDERLFPGKLLAATVRQLVAAVGEEKTAQIWMTSAMRWSQFLPEDKLEDFVKSNKLEFTLTLQSELSGELVRAELRKMVSTSEPAWTNDQIISWIMKEVGDRRTEAAFVRTLMTVVAEDAISGDQFSAERFKSRCKVLLFCLENDPDRELQALYALQHLMHRLQHPNMVLHMLFACLHENDVISEEAFLAWEKSDDPAEAEGKGVAITSTSKFLLWLTTEDGEGDDAADEDAVDAAS